MSLTEETREAADILTLGIALRGLQPAQRLAEFVASTDAVDTYGEIVDQGSWDLSAYVKNPVVLYAHNSRALPIGKSVDVAVRNGRLECWIEFAPESANPEAEKVWQLLQGGFLRAVSVGFIPRNGRYEMRDGNEVFVLYDNSLREISVTPVPANHEALAKMRAKAMAERPSRETNTEPAVGTQEESTMDEKTMQDLAEKTAELKAEREKSAALQAEVEALKSDVAAYKHESAVHLDGRKASDEQIAALREALGAPAGGAESPLDAAKRLVAEKAALADSLIERDVDALVGVKLAPAQRDAFLGLAKSDRAKFDAIVETMPELKVLGTVISAEDPAAPALGPDLADMLGDGTEAPMASSASADLSDLL